jgi:hypothetical protein
MHRTRRKLTFALIVLAIAITVFAGDKKQREWIPATVVSISKQAEPEKTRPQNLSIQGDGTVNARFEYSVETHDAVYVLEVVSAAAPGSSRWPAPRQPKMETGDKVEIAIKNKQVWLLDTAGKEILCTVVKKVAKPE